MAYSFIKKRDSGAFSCEFWDIFKNNFLRTTYGGCFCKWESLQKMCLYLMMKIVGQLPIASLFSLHKKRKFSTWSNLGETVDLVTFTEEILNGKLLFLCCDPEKFRQLYPQKLIRNFWDNFFETFKYCQ